MGDLRIQGIPVYWLLWLWISLRILSGSFLLILLRDPSEPPLPHGDREMPRFIVRDVTIVREIEYLLVDVFFVSLP